MFKIYCVHPISGSTPEEVFNYYDTTLKRLTEMGFDVLTPMFGKGEIRTAEKYVFQAKNHEGPVTNKHAIFGRDRWMVKQADIIYANFLGAKKASIGGCFELCWANDEHKQIVLVMDRDNIHQHAFVLEAATIIFETEEEAFAYLEKIAKKRN